ncbi:MAG: hypothetical protein J4O01_09310 [Chloroflexi bacterium]|nr:hypothetical protein [Chloroflexota bacterium]
MRRRLRSDKDQEIFKCTEPEFIAQILKQEGVTEMTCFPSNALIETAAKAGIRPLIFRHERGAIMAADGYYRMNDGQRFGVAAMQHAAGAENSMGGLSQAFGDNVPCSRDTGGGQPRVWIVDGVFHGEPGYRHGERLCD